jgi:hypothetical protein
MKRPLPSVSFSHPTLHYCARIDGLNLNIDYVNLHLGAPSLHVPASFATPLASDLLCEILLRIKSVWTFDTERAHKMVIDAIPTEVLLNNADDKLLGFC